MGLLRRRRPIVAAVEMGRGPAGFWYWRLRAHNGQVLGAAETYSDRAACHDTARPMADQLGVKLIPVDPLPAHPASG